MAKWQSLAAEDNEWFWRRENLRVTGGHTKTYTDWAVSTQGPEFYLTSFTLSSVYKTKWLEVPGEMRRTEMASLHRPQLQGCWAQLYSLEALMTEAIL